MEELKVQNSLLLQLVSGLQRQINSKNRQNQILFQQYDQLAADNRHLQAQTDQLRTLNNQLKKQIAPAHTHSTPHDSPPRPSPFDLELLELKKKNGQLMGTINQLKAQLEERGGTIILLQEELQKAKLEDKQTVVEEIRQAKTMLQLKEQAVAELTEYMQVQAEKISELTREGIQAIDNYQSKLAEKDTQCQTLSQQIAQLNQTIAQLQVVQIKEDVRVSELQAIIALKEQSIGELSEFLQMQSDKVSKLQANLAESTTTALQDEIEHLKQIVESKEQSVSELSEFLNILSQKNKDNELKIQQANQQKQEMTKQVDNATVKSLEEKIQQLLQQINAQNEKLAQQAGKTNEDETLLRESEMLRARLSTREDEVALLSSRLEEMEAEISDLRLQLDDKIVKITLLQNISQQNDAEFPNDQQQGQNDEPKPEAVIVVQKQEAAEATDIQRLLQMKQSEIQTLKSTVEQKGQSLQDFTDFISQQTEKITNLEKAIEELETIVKSKDQSIEQLRTFLDESYTKNAQLGDKNREMQENLSRIQKEIDEIKKKPSQDQPEQVEERINIILPPSHTELGSPLHPPSPSLHQRIQQLQAQLVSKTQTIAELSEFMNTQAESLRSYRQKQEQSPSDRIAELEAIIKLKDQSNNELSEFLQQAYAKTAEMDLSLNESQRNMLNAQEELFTLKVQQGDSGNHEKNNIAKELQETIQDLKVVIAQQQYNIQQLKKSSEGTALTLPPSQIENQLKEQIQSLEGKLASKQAKIGELIDFMNQQTQEVEKLTNKLESMPANSPCAFLSADEQELRRQVAELSQTLKSKDETINELTEFMTQQAEELEELRQHSPEEGCNRQQLLLQKVVALQEVVRLKELLQAETNQSLKEAYSKIAALEEQKEAIAKRQAELAQKMGEESKIIGQLNEQHKKVLANLAKSEDGLKELTYKLQKYEKQIRQLKEQPIHQVEDTEQKQNIMTLKATIEELEEVVNAKSQTIAELSQFMNEQSMRVEELEQKLNGPQSNSNDNKEKIEQLQAIIRSKAISIAQLTSFLQEAYAKNAEQAQASANSQEKPQQIQDERKKESQIQSRIVQRQSQLAKLNSQIEQKNAEISKANVQLQNVSRELKEEEQKLRAIKAEVNEAQSSYNSQLDEYNHHRESMESELGNIAQALQEQVAQVQQRQGELTGLHQQVDQLRSEIKRLEEIKKQLKNHGNVNLNRSAQSAASPAMAELQAKIVEYEGFLNDREEEMAAMMEVMQNLQAEISNKNEIINRLQENNPQSHNISDSANSTKIQQLQAEIANLKQAIQQMREAEGTQQKQVKVFANYGRLEAQDELMEESNNLKQQYQQELNNMNAEELDLERELNLNGNFNNEEQVDNNEQLTVLQVIEQILIYQEEQDLGNILRLIETLKRSYLRENECILKENNELKDTLSNLLEVNNRLVEELEKIKAELEQQRSITEQEQQRAKEAEQRANRLQVNYQQEIKQLRRSISGLRDESPISGKVHEEDIHTISRLEDQVVALRQENQQREVQLAQLKANSNKKFVNELNNLLDSCTVAKEGEELRQLEEELERVAAQRDEAITKCKDYEEQISALKKQCVDLVASLESATKNLQQASQMQNPQGQDSLQAAELLADLQQPVQQGERPSVLEESSLDKLRVQNQELQMLLQEKSAAINELEETMLGLEKGYNNEIMNLRKNIAELKSEAISLRKSLYQADPNGVDIHELIKDTFDHTQQDTQFFRPNYPTYTNSLLLTNPHSNNSYYSDAQQPRPSSNYQRFFPPNTQLNLGQKFMGRRCRQASPFSYGGEGSRVTAWQVGYPRY